MGQQWTRPFKKKKKIHLPRPTHLHQCIFTFQIPQTRAPHDTHLSSPYVHICAQKWLSGRFLSPLSSCSNSWPMWLKFQRSVEYHSQFCRFTRSEQELLARNPTLVDALDAIFYCVYGYSGAVYVTPPMALWLPLPCRTHKHCKERRLIA